MNITDVELLDAAKRFAAEMGNADDSSYKLGFLAGGSHVRKQLLNKADVISSADDFKSLALKKLSERLEWGIQLYEKGYGYIPPEKFGLKKAIEILQSM